MNERAGNDNVVGDVKLVCKTIAAALKKRSGKAWSVTHGRGTAYGWITIQSPPKRRGEYGSMTEEDRTELSKLLGETVHHQGVSIPASYEYRRRYIELAENGKSDTKAAPYWD